MNKLFQFMEKYFMPVAGKLAGQKHLGALRDGIALAMPMIIIGSVFLILGNLPFPHYSDWLANTFGKSFATKLSYPVDATFNMMGLIAAFGIAYRLAEAYEIDGVTAGVISVCAFLLAAPFQIPFTPAGAKTAIEVSGGIPVALMGSKGLFVAMLIALGSTEVYRWIVKKNIVIRMPDGVPPAVSKSFVALIPGFAVIVIVWALRLIVENTHFGSLFNIVGDILGGPLGVLGTSLWGSLIAELLVSLLWVCGLHGANIVGGVMGPIWLGAMGDNASAYAAHKPLPHIITQQFFDNFVHLGGSGATFGLVILFIFFAKSGQLKQLGKLAIGPGIFEINEPVTFGAPVVMNPLLVIPFILAPLMNIVATYIGMDLGLVARPNGVAVPWTTPPIISGFLATGSISGSIMQAFNLAMDFFIYLPFFMMYDKMLKKQEVEFESSHKAV
ncbi:PTS cellobiose transporter subunit IIC [Bacillus sp. BRMEA1]|uniref:PTS cellobiose transporter subunit IIC n=1 Tax=Neobacillus endophyticus TaxID=2738405 RepID=UPI001565A04F|nr:PTS cellobiose transporter subunit IIC [Neobacillus endophyticus]NRD76311.1 PTS cellobiose transporter subunit IIC [Neobacillus endophyticus]